MEKYEDVYIFGHKSPDTDSICSSMAYAYLKKQLGIKGAKAYRLGDINKETSFVLEYFGLKKPTFLNDVKLKVGDLSLYRPKSLHEDEPIKIAWDMLNNEEGWRIIPIVSDDEKVLGVLGMMDVAHIFMEVPDEEIVKHHEILYKNLVSILNGVHVGGNYNYDKLGGSLYIGTNIPDDTKINDKDVVIVGKIDQAWRLAYEHNFGCIILTNGIKPIGLEGAKCAVVCVDYTMFKTVSLVSQAISVGSIMNKNQIITFSEESYIDDISEIMRTSRHRNFPVVNRAGELYGIMSRRHLMDYKGKKVILIDHNERSQSVDGLEQATILEIIDHHRVADIQTKHPLYIRSEPVGCTSTIIYKMYKENNVDIPKNIAGIMLSAILSDTLMFNSPTCTPEDELVANELARLAEIEILEYGRKMFKAGTSIENYSVNDILLSDQKRFSFGKNTAYISQINTLDFSSIYVRLDEIIQKMEVFYKETECSLVMLMITDIIAGGSEVIAIGRDKELLVSAFGMEHSQQHMFLPGVVSRKQQIVPKLASIAITGIV